MIAHSVHLAGSTSGQTETDTYFFVCVYIDFFTKNFLHLTTIIFNLEQVIELTLKMANCAKHEIQQSSKNDAKKNTQHPNASAIVTHSRLHWDTLEAEPINFHEIHIDAHIHIILVVI